MGLFAEHFEVGCGAYIADNARMRIAISIQFVSKAADVCSAQASTQAARSLLSCKMSFDQLESPVCGLPDPAAVP